MRVSATRTGANEGPASDGEVMRNAGDARQGLTVGDGAEQDGTGDSYTVVLDTEPTADVVVTVAGHSGTDGRRTRRR